VKFECTKLNLFVRKDQKDKEIV